MKEVKLTNSNLVAVVDDEDFDRVNRHKWQLRATASNNYAQTTINGKAWQMHHVVMKVRSRIDHKNNNGLNNKKDNLRFVTQSQNMQNTSIRNDNTSGFKGVNLDKRRNKWRAYISINKLQTSLGYFKNRIEAAQAYDAAAKKYFGEFAKLNFPSKENTDGTFWPMNLLLF